MGQSILAGLVCGYLMAIITSLLVARMLLDARDEGGAVRRYIAPTMSFPLVATGVFTAAFWIWPAAGVLIGAAYGALRDSGEQFAASPNVYFSLALTAVALPQAAAASIALRRVSFTVLAYVALFAGLFGWAVPNLAEI